MININMLLLMGIISFIVCGIGVLLVIKKLTVLDVPNNRSSHTTPTPRGGGIAIVFTIIASFIILNLFDIDTVWKVPPHKYEIWVILGCFLMLAAVSFIDDLKGLSFAIRLFFHFAAATAAVAIIPLEAKLTPDFIPLIAERVALVFLLVWFINLYNFMDGIDGITAIETISIGAGLFGLFIINFLPLYLGAYGLFIAFAALAFLFFNWHPAKIFMGDVGSISLGFILGWLLLKTAYEGNWTAAVILPLYYLIDATSTLVLRILQRKKPWEAHKDHFYQKLHQKGFSHSEISLTILRINAVLVFFAITSCFNYKVIYMSLIYVSFMIYKSIKAGQPEKTYKEIKNDVISGIKSEFTEAKNNINIILDKNKNNKDDHND
ncbi:MAG: glycosyltransferase family 4 protein [Alphaproteobacteria bacterium]